ncbi:MAG: NAD(P)-dependent oxidoreductase [Rubrivivax sp.]|nr:NAD(P)-dependent oxidoreductase [Rubrivivax sp.]
MNASATRPKILVTNPIHAAVRVRLEAVGDVEMNHEVEPWNPAQLAARARGAHAMMGFMTDRVDAALLAKAPSLRVVACALKGFDSYDVDACTHAGVWLSIVPDLLTEPTAELALGLAIALARNVMPGDALVRSRQFRGWRPQLYGTGLAGATVAVIGLGQVGQAIVARLVGFGCARIVGVDPCQSADGVERLSLEQALAQAHFVFVAAPLTAESHHLIDAAALAHARPGQFMVNVGRGSVVNEEAIADALDSGKLAGYAADVFAMEDWGLANRPSVISPRLVDRSNTVFTPHLGSAVSEVRIAIEQRAAENIIAVLHGRAPADAINQPETTLGRRHAC